MMQAFTAGAWNPKLMKAGFAAMLTDGTDSDGMTAEGALDCEKLADSARAEIVAIQGVGLLLRLADEGDTVTVFPSDPDAYDRVKASAGEARTRLFRQGTEFTDYFGDGAFMFLADPRTRETTPIMRECLDKVRRMASIKAGLIEDAPAAPPVASADGDGEDRCPVCNGLIDQDDIDVNNNTEDGYGEMKVPHMCPHCGAGLYAYYDAQDGYAFLRFETD